MQKPQLSPAQFRQLIRLNRRLTAVLFSIAPKRDLATGSFTVGSSLTGSALREAGWGGRQVNPGRADFKKALLAALRSRSVSKP